MRKLDLVYVLDGKTIDQAIAILERIRRKHPDARLESNSEWDSTQLYVEYPRTVKRRPRVQAPKPPLTPIEQMLFAREMELLFGDPPGNSSGIAYWLDQSVSGTMKPPAD
jgi:hypothetical protein